ncbi:hypothetical protein A3J36_00155 [Candidatus Uhrbacteria bacterium RIFCSPLOWO2_02_FULL_54_37]|uniref:Uncharacterized protein n=2 Tax=Candidatus Uhriibacteriota TaxID=1752732 RepID=A0A1F7VHQ2_9BACT|nr:MAG: hypothetical protein A3B36_02730 [Candidatus Uhrbacteria bacterium RIFCSPLOWO2_01_FULL_55_36]OGL89708.1 MAG: hypothetical protein A3J36_00155 [Candidatus Uhrbacteria bacterium RIFCSPLOWO2_02_FULL_54_37]
MKVLFIAKFLKFLETVEEKTKQALQEILEGIGSGIQQLQLQLMILKRPALARRIADLQQRKKDALARKDASLWESIIRDEVKLIEEAAAEQGA